MMRNIRHNLKRKFKINKPLGKIIQKLSRNSDMNNWWKHRDASLHYSLKSIKKENENTTHN